MDLSVCRCGRGANGHCSGMDAEAPPCARAHRAEPCTRIRPEFSARRFRSTLAHRRWTPYRAERIRYFDRGLCARRGEASRLAARDLRGGPDRTQLETLRDALSLQGKVSLPGLTRN